MLFKFTHSNSDPLQALPQRRTRNFAKIRDRSGQSRTRIVDGMFIEVFWARSPDCLMVCSEWIVLKVGEEEEK
jgi:hypothetical protein